MYEAKDKLIIGEPMSVSFFSIPQPICKKIVKFINPTKITHQEVKECGRCIVLISLTCKEFKTFCDDQLKVIKRINELLNKYSTYSKDYENETRNSEISKITENLLSVSYPGGNPQLTDIFMSTNKYSNDIEKDIIDIIKLTPQSLNCRMGSLRLRTFVPPLALASFKPQVPLHIVKLLLDNGADPDACYGVEFKQSVSWLKKDLEDIPPDHDEYQRAQDILKKLQKKVEEITQ